MKKKRRSQKSEARSQKAKGGRPAVITAAVVEEVSKLMATGMPEEFACALVGVNAATFGPAVSRNEALKAIHRKHHAEFMRDSLDIIRAGGEKVQVVNGHDKDGTPLVVDKIMPWSGRAWILERRYKPWFTKTIVEASGDKDESSSGTLSEQTLLVLEAAMKAEMRLSKERE